MDTKSVFKKAVNLVTLSSFLLWNLAAATPEGGQVVAGSAQISQSQNQTVINQSSQSTVINWNGFNTAANESVKFNQPNSSAIALNKINSGLPTNFNGSLSANGQVWIINPAGVLFGSSANVNVAGLLATTHNINNSDFMAGNYNFAAPTNLSASIINNGSITVADSGIVALVAPYVVNNGIIQANLGKVALSTGGAFVLDLYGDSLINFGSNSSISNGSVENNGLIEATGGKVFMTANAASGLLDNVISMAGTIKATSATTGEHGEIILNGGHAGKVKVSGKLETSSKDGFVETSGAYLDLDPTTEITAADWLLDPLTINLSSYGSLVQNILNAGTNVTLSTGVSALTSGTGDININQTLSWSTAAVLTLAANHNINISQNITATSGGGVVLHADFGGTAGGTVLFSGGAKINVSGPATIYYYPGTTPGTANYSTPTNFNANFLGTLPTVYMAIDSTADLATLASQSLIAGVNAANYNLANNVTYAGTAAIFPTDASNNGFAGIFDGHNYVTGTNNTISGFNITASAGNTPSGSSEAAFTGRLMSTGVIKDVNFSGNVTNAINSTLIGGVAGLSEGLISNLNYTGTVNTTSQLLIWQGGLAGILNNGTISGSSFSGTVSDNGGSGAFGSVVGGLIGEADGTTTISRSAVLTGSSVTGSHTMEYIGGLVGNSPGGLTMTNSYNQANVSGSSHTSGGIIAGASNSNTLTNVYNSGNVTGSVFGNIENGAIIGHDYTATASLTGTYYNNTNCPGCATTYGGSPLSTAAMQSSGSFSGYNFSNIWMMSASSPFFPVLQSTANTTSTNTVLGTGSLSLGSVQSVSVYVNGVFSSTVTSSGSGAFAFIYSPDLFGLQTFLATTNSSLPGAILNKINVTGPSFISGLNIILGQVTVDNSAGSGTLSNSDLIVASGPTTPYTTSGNNITLGSGVGFATTSAAPYVLNGNITASGSGGDITFGGTVTLASNASLTSDFGNITFNNTINGNGSGPWDLTINDNTSGGNPPPTGPGVVTFNGIVGGSNPLNSLTVDSSFGVVMNTSAISTILTQSYNPNVIFSPTVYLYSPALNLTGSNINFNNSVVINHNLSNPNALTITGNMAAAQNAAFRTTTGGFGFVGSLHVTGTSLLGGGVGTQNTQTYDGNVTVTTAGSAFFSSDNTNIIFNSTLKGTGSNTLNFFTTNGATTFNGQVGIAGNGSALSISNLAITANTININTPNIYTNASQTYTGAVSVLQDTTLTSYTSGPTFSTSASTINSSGGAHDLTITATSGTAEFDGAVGALQALKDLVVNAFAITFKTSQVHTTLNQNYTSPGGMTINNVGLITFTGSNVQFNSPVNSSGTPAQIQIDANFVMANTASIGQASNVAQLAVLNGNSASIRGNITTTGDTDFSGPVVLTANTSITDTGTGIYFHSTVDSDAFGPWSLTLSAAPTTVQFEDIVGTVPLSSLIITATDINVMFGATGITTTGDQTYNATDVMSVFAFATLTGNNITVNAPLEPAFDSVFDAAGILWFKNTIDFGGHLTAIGDNYVQFDGMIGFFGAMQDIDVTGGGIKINTNYINTSGYQDYHSPVTLLTDAASPRGFYAGSDITFESTLDGAHQLYLQADTIDFKGMVGNSAPLSNLSIAGTNNINIETSVIKAVNTINFDSPVNILQDTTITITGSFFPFVAFGDRVEGPNMLTVSVPSGDVFFWNKVGSQTPLSALTVTARNNVGATDQGIIFNLSNANEVTTTGAQIYNGMISFADVPFIRLTGSSVTFNGPADSYDIRTQVVIGDFITPTDLFISSAGVGQLFASSGNVEISTLTVNGGTFNAGNVTTKNDQTYVGGYTLTANNVLNSISGSITFGNFIGADVGTRDLTISAVNGIAEFDTPNVPVQGLRNLDVTAGNIDINGSVISTTGTQHYHNFTIFNNGLSTLTAGTVVIFDSFLAGPGGLSVSSVGPITFAFQVGTGPFLDSLEVAASLININTTYIRTTNTQEYHNNVLINNVGAINFRGSNVQFDAPLNSTGTPAQITITGGLTLANTGSIGQSSDVSSLIVTGPSSLRNVITTTGDPIFGGAVTLTADTTITDLSATGIVFQSTVDSDAFGPWSLILNATAGPVVFNGDVGSSGALHNLTVQNSTEIDFNTPGNPIMNIITTGFQTYNGNLVFSVNGAAGSVVQYYLTAGGDITVNNQITAPAALNSGLDVFINTSGNVFLKDDVLLNPGSTGVFNHGGYLDVTASGDIYLGTFGGVGAMLIQTANVATPTSGTTQSLIFRSPILLDQNVTFDINSAAAVFDGTIDSDYINHPGSAFSVAFTGTSYFLNINAPIGSLGELQSVTSDSNNFGVNVGTQSQDNDLFPGIPNFSVTTVANQTYLTSMFMYIAFGGTVLFKSDTGTVTFTETDSLHALAVSGGCVFACPTTFNGNFVLNGDAVIHGSLLALNGSVTLNNAMIMTDASQEYDGTLILNGANNILNATNINQTSASNIYFAPGSIIDGQGNNLTLTLFQTGPSNSYRDTAIFDNTMASSIGTLDITADKVTQSVSSVLTATNLITNTNEGMDLSQGTNSFQTFTATNGTGVSGQSEDNINLTNTAAPLTILGITQNGNNTFINNDININNTGDIHVHGTISSPVVGNAVSLITTGAISQNAAGNINSDILSTSSVIGTNLATASPNNQVNNYTASNTVSGDIDFSDDVSTVFLTGITQTGGNVNITNTGDIRISNDINSLGEIVTLTSTLAGIPQWFGNVNADTLNAITVTGSNITATINNYSALNTTAGSINLTSNQSVNITSITQSAPFGNLGILAFGNITQTGAISVIANSGFTTLNGSIDLATNGGSNNFQGTVGLSTLGSGDAQIFNNANLNLRASSIAGNLTSVAVTGGDVINIVGNITAGGSQTYNNPVIVAPQFSSTLTLKSGTGILFNSTIDDVSAGTNDLIFQGTSGAAIVTVDGNIGGTAALLTLYADPTVPEFDFNGTLIHTVQSQTYWNDLVLSQANVTLQNDNTQSFDFYGIFIQTGITAASTNLEINGDIYYGYDSGNIINVVLASLLVDSGMTSVMTDGTTITTTGTQVYNGQVLLENNSTQGPVSLAASTITFNDMVISDPWNSFSGSASDLMINGDLHAKADIGPTNISSPFIPSGQDGTLNSLSLTGNVINFSSAVTQVNTFQAQTYIGSGLNPLLTVNADPVFTAGSFAINIPVLINAATTYNSTAGDIDFQSTVDGDGVSSLILNPVGGSAIFGANVGFTSALGSLAVNGTTNINGAPLIQTNGDQIYSDTVTINNSVTMNTLVNGDIQYNGGGVVDAGANTLTASSADTAKGPLGHGITGKVNVTNLTLGGPGGANLSEDYPVSESFVGGQGGQQARTNTIAPPNVEGVVIYCVNGFNCSPVPVNNVPNNIPQLQVFNLLTGLQVCDSSGCSNLAVVFDDVAEAGSINCVVGFAQIMDQAGQKRIAFPGVSIYAGESIVADAGTQVCVKSLDGKIECKTAAR